MAKHRNKALIKLRKYRDKLMAQVVVLESAVRIVETSRMKIHKALGENDLLRAYALSAAGAEHDEMMECVNKEEVIKELALVYKMLAVERNYTDSINKAAMQRDLLRVVALTEDHKAEQIAHDKMLSRWSIDHGFTQSLRTNVMVQLPDVIKELERMS